MDKRGFTLIEILVTMTILGMIAALIGAAFKIGITSWEKGEERLDKLQRVRVIFDSMIQDIRSYYIYKFPEPLEGKHKEGPAFEGEENKLSFVTTASGFNMGGILNSGLRVVSYYVAEDRETGKKCLFLREAPVVTGEFFTGDIEEEGTITKLYNDIEEIKFTYTVLTENFTGERELSQVDEWKPMDSMDTHQTSREILLAVSIEMKILDEKDTDISEEKYVDLAMTVVVGREEIKRMES